MRDARRNPVPSGCMTSTPIPSSTAGGINGVRLDFHPFIAIAIEISCSTSAPVRSRDLMHDTNPGTSALLTDLYELTMALGYWKEGRAEQEAAFHLYFRSAPFRGGYTIACGLEPAL